jgi:hypothetical protein
MASAAQAGFKGTEAQFLLEDAPVFGLCAAIVAALGWAPRAWLAGLARIRPRPRIAVLALAGLTLAAGWAGERLLFHGYVLSLDEHLANFDARIFVHGELAAPVDPRWRPFVPAMQPIYMAPIPSHAHWVSGYLPVAAALRALASAVGLTSLVNPLLSAFAVLAVFAVARRLWPERPGLALGAAALLASSSQLILTAMTAYAMPAHLACNLAWLWLFLRGGRLGHAGAILVGFLACGLHQILFHPLFVAPFMLQLCLDRRWPLAGLYILAYAAIGAFWIEFPQLELGWIGEATASGSGAALMAERVRGFLAAAQPGNVSAMMASLVRFLSWQNPLTAPLALVGVPAAWRAKGVTRALVLGVLLTLGAMLVLEPTQTQGWGYRYLHGLLGSVALLAMQAWDRLTARLTDQAKAAARGAFTLACAAGLLLLTPLRAGEASAYARPYAEVDALVRRAPEPAIVVDNQSPWFDAGTVVRNDPFLRRGPKVMLLAALDERQVRALCAQGSVGVVDAAVMASAGVSLVATAPDPASQRLRALMAQLNCGRPLRAG